MDAELLPFRMTVRRAGNATSQSGAFAHLATTPVRVTDKVPCAIQEKTINQNQDGHAVPVTQSNIFSNYAGEIKSGDLLEVTTPLRVRSFEVSAAHPVYDEELGVLDHWELSVGEVKV